MKIFEIVNQETKTYIIGILLSAVAIMLISAVVFMFLVADKLDVVMSQNAKITYTYFIMIMDRILLLSSVLFIIPITIYQISGKNKTTSDKTVSIISILIISGVIGTIFAGQYTYFQNYKNGDLNNSVMFSAPSIETKIFDKLLNKS